MTLYEDVVCAVERCKGQGVKRVAVAVPFDAYMEASKPPRRKDRVNEWGAIEALGLPVYTYPDFGKPCRPVAFDADKALELMARCIGGYVAGVVVYPKELAALLKAYANPHTPRGPLFPAEAS